MCYVLANTNTRETSKGSYPRKLPTPTFLHAGYDNEGLHPLLTESASHRQRPFSLRHAFVFGSLPPEVSVCDRHPACTGAMARGLCPGRRPVVCLVSQR